MTTATGRTVLRGARIIDGTGADGFDADVAVEGGRIAQVGAVAEGVDDVVVDLSGAVLAPGFIDPHTHYDAQVLWDGALTPSCWHGVTTAVMGNCGFGLAPTRPEHRDVLCRMLENVEGMSYEALSAGITWGFETFTDWLEVLRSLPKRVNVASYIGHSPLRLYVMGEEAFDRPATAEEARQMRAIVHEALMAGAAGFATSMTPNHVGDRGRPVPSRLADRAEIWEIAGALADAGRGVLAAAVGPGLFLAELAELAELTGRPVTWTALLTRGGVPWPPWAPEADRAAPGELLRRQRELHPDVWPQVSCRDLVMQVQLSDPSPFLMLPAFKEVIARERRDRAGLYADPGWRDRARPQIDGYWGHRWSKLRLHEAAPSLRPYIGRTIAAIAADEGTHPFDVMADLGFRDGVESRFELVMANDDPDLADLLRSEHTLVALSDAGAHASQLSDACYTTHLLGHWVRDRGVMSLEQAVHRLTGQVAELFGLAGRGRVATGGHADLVAFDPAQVGPGRLERVHDLPAGADRLVSRSDGILGVWVAGERVDVDGGEGRAPGRLLAPDGPGPTFQSSPPILV